MRSKRRQREKTNIPMLMAGVLLCLTLFSTYLTSNLYARYTTSSEQSDSARVITFGQVTLTESGDFGDDGTMMIIPGVDLEKKAVVNFTGSEASVYIFLKIELEAGAANWTRSGDTFYLKNGEKELMRWSVDSGAETDDWSLLDGSEYVYYLELEPNQILNDKNIILNDALYVSDEITRSEIEVMSDISILFQAAAVQSGGFADAETAWQSISGK